MKKLTLLTVIALVVLPGTAAAYTGPGLGMATIVIVVGFFTSIFIALFAVVWYPVKRVLKKRKKPGSAAPGTQALEVAKKTDTSAEPIE